MGEYADALPIECEAGEQGLVLRLRAGGTVSGTVVDPSTGSGRETQLSWGTPNELAFGMSSTSTKPDGTFSVSGLEPGPYRFMGQDEKGRMGLSARLDVRANEKIEGIRIELRPSGRLRLRGNNAEPNWAVIALADGVAVASDRPDPNRAVEVQVPAGEITLRLVTWQSGMSPTLLEERNVTVGEGETKDVDLSAAKK